jgi:hypothetical protein
MSVEDIESYTKRLAKGYVQLKKNIDLFESNQFNDEIGMMCTDAKGLLLIYDDYYFHRQEIYEKALELLNSEGYKVDITELQNKMLLVTLYNLENILISVDEDIITYVNKQFAKGHCWADYVLGFEEYSSEVKGLPEFDKFIENYIDGFQNRLEKLMNF